MSDEGVVTQTTRDGTTVDSSQTAKNVAGKVLGRQGHESGQSQEGAQPPVDLTPSPVADIPDNDVGESQEAEDLTQESQEGQEGQPRQTPEQSQGGSQDDLDEITDEVYQELQSYGIDLGVPPSQVAPELKDSYTQMAQTVIKLAAESRAQELEARQRQMQVQDFMTRLESDPTDIMMLVALNKPEAFREAMETYDRIQSDPREKEILERELRLRAQEQAQQRREQLARTSERQRKANRVKSQLKTACQRYGVNPQIAERLVASEIRTKGDITNAEIVQIVSQLKPAQTLTPQKQRQAQQTPNKATGGGAPSGDSGRERESSPGLERKEVTSLRGTVKDAIRRYSSN